MKLLIEFIMAIILHPIAAILCWVDLARRGDLPNTEKIVWGVVCIIWGIGPIFYILVGGGALWRGRAPGEPRGSTYTMR